jgi:hypothetical protein
MPDSLSTILRRTAVELEKKSPSSGDGPDPAYVCYSQADIQDYIDNFDKKRALVLMLIGVDPTPEQDAKLDALGQNDRLPSGMG